MKKEYYQYIRGICILCVLLIHTLFFVDDVYINDFNIVVRRIINFAVPIFIFLSGYFIKYDNIKSFYKNKLKRLLIPLIIWKLIYGFVAIISNKYNFIASVKAIITQGFHLYYLIVLIMLVIITPLLIKYINKQKNKFLLYFPLVITLIYNIFITILYIKNNTNFFLYNYHIFGWFSYYYLGLLFRYNKINIENCKANKYLIAYIVSLGISFAEGMILYNKYGIYDLSVSQITISNFMYAIIICLIIKINDEKRYNNRFIVKLGDYSYGIFLSHILILRIINKFIKPIEINYFIKILLIYVLLVSITYIVNAVYYKIKKVKHDYNRG